MLNFHRLHNLREGIETVSQLYHSEFRFVCVYYLVFNKLSISRQHL